MSTTIALASSDAEIDACFGVMRQLRPHLDQTRFVEIVKTLQADGYQLASLSEDDEVRAVAGFRFKRTLFCDRFLYVDDLVTGEAYRSTGLGAALLEWLRARADEAGCAEIHLDSGIQRAAAHAFYQANGFEASAFHFKTDVRPRVPWSLEA